MVTCTQETPCYCGVCFLGPWLGTQVVGFVAFLALSLAAVCFSIYDLKNTGLVTREEMFHLLKSTMIKVCLPPSEEHSSTHIWPLPPLPWSLP